MVVVDILSKYDHFVPLAHLYTTEGVVEQFIKEIVRLHGVPKSIVCDRDAVFASKFWKEFFKLQGSRIRMSSAYHPQMDGQLESLNRSIETSLRCFAMEKPQQWVK